MHGIIAAIDAGRHIATARGRSDLDAHLGQTRDQLAARTVTVVVVGEFKRGKSTLINALLQHAVCPVDADVVTAVPTTVRYADHPRVLSYVRTEDGGRTDEVEESLDNLTALVTEEADPADPDRMRTVEVGLPHRMLRSGLCLVDTPGVGGLDSAHGFLTLGALRMAQGTLFVTDAAQELTGPELEFLKTAVERCPLTALVVTKTDLYPQWRRIVELDRGHLARAGLDLPVIPVSSFLRLRAAKEPALNDESGFADLVAYLAGEVVAKARAGAAQAAAREVEFVASQLEQQNQAERAVLAEPERREEVVAELSQAQQQTRKLLAPTATWQQTLADGIQDLVADVEHDLQSRLRTVIHDVEEIIDQGDPKDTWADTEVWLRRQVAIVAVANRDMLTARAEELTTTVAEQFDLEAGNGIALHLEAVGEALDAVVLAPASSLTMPGGKLAPLMMAARTSFYVPAHARQPRRSGPRRRGSRRPGYRGDFAEPRGGHRWQDHRGREEAAADLPAAAGQGGRAAVHRGGRVHHEQADSRRTAQHPAAAAGRLPGSGHPDGPVGHQGAGGGPADQRPGRRTATSPGA